MNEEVIKECIREIDTIKKRLTGMLANKKVEVFEKPTMNECCAYFREKMGAVANTNDSINEGMKFFAYYESNGWKVGKNQMKDWKAAASQWIRRNQDREKNKRLSRSDRHDEATRNFLQSQQRRHG